MTVIQTDSTAARLSSVLRLDTPAITTTDVRYRYWGAFRLFLALMVLFGHYWSLDTSPLRSAIVYVTPGTIAVPVFFAISGFVIAEAICAIYLYKPFRFILNRAIRILIPFWIILAITVAVTALIFYIDDWAPTITGTGIDIPISSISEKNIFENFFYVWPREFWPTYKWPAYTYLGQFWSVKIEIAFYVVCFFCLLSVQIVPPPERKRALILMVLAAGSFMLVTALYSIATIDPKTWLREPAGATILFSIGVLIYFLENHKPLLRIAVPFVLLGAVVSYPSLQYGPSAERMSYQEAILIFLLAGAFLLKDARFEKYKRVDQFLGDLSYSLYITHFLPLLIIRNLLDESPFTFVVGIVSALSFSVAFQLVVGKITNRLRDRVRGKKLREALAQRHATVP